MKWTDKDGVTRIRTEDFDDDEYSDENKFRNVTIKLDKGERLIGFRSRQKGDKEGDYCVQFVKGTPK